MSSNCKNLLVNSNGDEDLAPNGEEKHDITSNHSEQILESDSDENILMSSRRDSDS